MIQRVRRHVAAIPHPFSIHIDDLHQSIVADTVDEAVRSAVQAGESLYTLFTTELGLPFAASKGYCLSNSREALAIVSKRFASVLGQPAHDVRRLGYDSAANPTIKKPRVMHKRYTQFCKRARFIRCKYKGRRYGRVFVSGLQPAALFGAECIPCHPDHIRRMRVEALKARGLYIWGASLDLLWCLGPYKDDPRLRALEAPLVRYAREWWGVGSGFRMEDNLSPKELNRAFCVVRDRFDPSLPYGRQWKDPITAAFLTVAFLGWSWHNACTLVDHRGVHYALQEGSPALLRTMLRNRYIEVVTDTVARTAGVSEKLDFLPYRRTLAKIDAEGSTGGRPGLGGEVCHAHVVEGVGVCGGYHM